MKRFFPICVGISLLGIGAFAIADAKKSATIYGLPTENTTALAYVRGCGIRDIAVGLAILSRLDEARTMLLLCSLIAITDATSVAFTACEQPSAKSLAIHGGSAVALFFGALFQDRRSA